jgi:putative hemolysin
VILIRLLAVLFLIGVNAFFAATEFALVAVRTSRLRQLVALGNAQARVVAALAAQLERVVSGVQVGITITTLALGFLGEITIAKAIRPLLPAVRGAHAALLANGIALVVAYLLLTIFHVVLGELVPKAVSLNRAERVALLVARPFQFYLRAFSWAIGLLDGMSRSVVRALGVTPRLSHTMVHSAEELKILIEQARERGLLAPGEEKFIQGALELSHVTVRDIMVPRPDMHAVPVDATLPEVLQLFARTQRSRLPVYEGTVDHIVGLVHMKDLFTVMLEKDRRLEQAKPAPSFDLRRIVREAVIVPESKPASELLAELRTRGNGMAMVVDEFGSILGLVTLEDAVEQIVGEIHDEFDLAERPVVLPDGSVIFEASLNVRDLEVQFGIELPEDPAYATLGGFALAQLGFIPRGGESFEYGGYRFTVLEMDRRRVARLKLQKLVRIAETPPEPGAPRPKPERPTGSPRRKRSEQQAAEKKANAQAQSPAPVRSAQ